MRFEIKSRVLGTTMSFWMRDEGGYVHLESPTKKGGLGAQITHNTACLSATPDTFESVCRRWYRWNLDTLRCRYNPRLGR